MKKVEQALTTKLLKVIDDGAFSVPVWGEIKVVERPKRFSTRVLSNKAKMMLQYTKLRYKFSDAAGLGTPLDFIYLPKVQPLLCVIFYKKREPSIAYFIKYDGSEYLKTEAEFALEADQIITIK
ncbi:hypothetical protein N8148_03060 [Gammaproteobacteria bacterium]|nr:hypothetical protein [Gammaproteobacteria bacterium]